MSVVVRWERIVAVGPLLLNRPVLLSHNKLTQTLVSHNFRRRGHSLFGNPFPARVDSMSYHGRGPHAHARHESVRAWPIARAAYARLQ